MLSAVTENEPIAELAAAPCSAACAFGQEEARRIQEELEKDLEAHEISHRSGGSAGSVAYMEGWRAIEKATHIFGFNGWSSRIIEIKVRNRRCTIGLLTSATDAAGHCCRLPQKEYEAQDKGKQKWDTCYSAIVRIELKDGTFHEDVGLGNGLDRDRHKVRAACMPRTRASPLIAQALVTCYDGVRDTYGQEYEPPVPSSPRRSRASAPARSMRPSNPRSW